MVTTERLLGIAALALMAMARSSCGLLAGQKPATTSPKGINQNLVKQFPEGEGKEIVLSACVQCHGLGEIVSHRMDTKGWQKSILDMVARGTQLLPGEAETLVQYLAANFAPLLNINEATAAKLASLPSVDKTLAEAIVRYREKNGPFKEIRDVSKVEGVSPQILDRIKDKIATSSVNNPAEKNQQSPR